MKKVYSVEMLASEKMGGHCWTKFWLAIDMFVQGVA